MIRTYPDGTVYDSDLTNVEFCYSDNAVAMELVEVVRKVSRRLEAVEDEFKSYQVERESEWGLHSALLAEERRQNTDQVATLKASVADLQAKLDAIKAVLA